MDSASPKPNGSFSFSRPQDKNALFHHRATTSFKTSNPDIFPSLNPFGSFVNNHKKIGEPSVHSSTDELQDIPLKKTKSENLSINMLARSNQTLACAQPNPTSPNLGLLREIKNTCIVNENNKLTSSERENIKGYMDNFYTNELLSEITTKESPKSTGSAPSKEETDRKETLEPLFMPANIPNAAQFAKQEIYKSLFSNLVKEFEVCWKRQLIGLYELDRWYNTDVPFSQAVPESIHLLLLDRLSKKLKIEQESLSLIHKVQNVFEINQEYKDKFKEYTKTKGLDNTPNGKSDKKTEKTRVIVLDGNCDASALKMGCHIPFQDLEDGEKGKELKEHA